VESIRRQVDAHTTVRKSFSTSVDLPFANECRRVLAYAAEEPESLGHTHIGTQHLLVGLIRDEHCFAAGILYARGLRISNVHEGDAYGRSWSRGAQDICRNRLARRNYFDSQRGGALLGHTPAEVPLACGERLISITKQGLQNLATKVTGTAAE